MSTQLAPSFEAHGDTLYRLALVLADDEGRAARLLRDLAVGLGRDLAVADGGPVTLDEPALIGRLLAAARAAEAREAGARPRLPARPRAPLFAPFAIYHLSLDQRLALGAHLLLGYDGPRIAAVLGGDAPAARAALAAAVRALGPAVGTTLTDRVGGDQCAGVRAVLADPSAGSRQSAAVRGHLAGCASCRAFDQAWGTIITAVEETLRNTLRPRVMPAALRARLLAAAAPRARRLPPWRSARLILAPLGVLALIAALVLPGFTRQSVQVVAHDPAQPVDARELVGRALVRHTTPPTKSGVWYGRFETLWYFQDDLYAPLRAELWLDPRNAARHRLQLTHRDGGAPYELQIGDGTSHLAYALDAAYAPSLYGALPTAARVEEPALVLQPLDAAGQVRARDERLGAGPWSLPPAYLRQAQAASDLRLLGRQLDGGRLVQIVSFSGVSPLGLPPDVPGATAERVTVLLALDSEDGLLRSATELAGPAGAAQTGRVTWCLVAEQWLTGADQINEAFASERAWSGIGSFADTASRPGADPAVPLVEARAVGDPAALLTVGRLPFWMPARAPAGADRALLLWDPRERVSGGAPYGLIYLGPGRRLIIAYNRSQLVEGEGIAAGSWRVTLRPGRGDRYTAAAVRSVAAPDLERAGIFDPSAKLMLDAYGFSRAEIAAVIASMAPFDLGALTAVDGLFVRPGADDAEPRQAILAAVTDLLTPPADGALRLTSRLYVRQMPGTSDRRRDPYHLPPYEGRPEKTLIDEWQFGAGPAMGLYIERSDPTSGALLDSRYADGERAWYYLPLAAKVEAWPPELLPATKRLPMVASLAVELLGRPGALSLERLPGGGAMVRHSEQAATSSSYGGIVVIIAPSEPHLFDLSPITMTTELELSPKGAAVALRVYAEGRDGGRVTRTLVQSAELLTREVVLLADAPAPVRSGEPPAARFAQPAFVAAERPAVILRRETLDQALGWPGVPLYVPQEGPAMLLAVEEGALEQPGSAVSYSAVGDALREAVARRLALRTTYQTLAGEDGPVTLFDIQILQGPAEDLRTFLRGAQAVPWLASEPIELTVAGQVVEAWYGFGDHTYLLLELGPTLLVVDTIRSPDDPLLRDILAGLRPWR